MGQEPEPFTFVRGTHVGRGEQHPFRIPPCLAEISEDGSQPVLSELGDVLDEQPFSSASENNIPECRPEPSFVVEATLATGAGERLARDPASDDVHDAVKLVCWEGGEVIPDRSAIQGLIFHAGDESGRCVGFPLNVSHGSYVEAGESQGEGQPAVSGAGLEGM